MFKGEVPVLRQEEEEQNKAHDKAAARQSIVAEHGTQGRSLALLLSGLAFSEPAGIGQGKGDGVGGQANDAEGIDLPSRDTCQHQSDQRGYDCNAEKALPSSEVSIPLCQQDDLKEDEKKYSPPSHWYIKNDGPRALRHGIAVDRFTDGTKTAVQRVGVIFIVAVGRIQGDKQT